MMVTESHVGKRLSYGVTRLKSGIVEVIRS